MSSKVFFIENPLLDLSNEQTDDSMLKKYQLTHGQASLATPEQLPMYQELFKDSKTELIPGGSTLNTCRTFNFLQKEKNLCQYFGCVGQDEIGQRLEKTLNDLHITAKLHKDSETPTGTCACLILNNERTLCANLAACLKYPLSHLEAHMEDLQQAQLMYSSAFFITSNFEALKRFAQFAAEKNIPFGFNLSAVFLIQFNLNEILEILPFADFVFANEDEGAAFAESQGWKYEEFVANLQKFRKVNEKRQRCVVLTQGHRNVQIGDEKGVREIEVVPLEKAEVVDTNGAGDSFVGGFLT